MKKFARCKQAPVVPKWADLVLPKAAVQWLCSLTFQWPTIFARLTLCWRICPFADFMACTVEGVAKSPGHCYYFLSLVGDLFRFDTLVGLPFLPLPCAVVNRSADQGTFSAAWTPRTFGDLGGSDLEGEAATQVRNGILAGYQGSMIF